jgi:hypothetical protein
MEISEIGTKCSVYLLASSLAAAALLNGYFEHPEIVFP